MQMPTHGVASRGAATESGRRADTRRPDGNADAFGSALSAELDRSPADPAGTGDQDRTADRTGAHRADPDRGTADRGTADRGAADRGAADLAAAQRTAAHRAAQRTATQRVAAAAQLATVRDRNERPATYTRRAKDDHRDDIYVPAEVQDGRVIPGHYDAPKQLPAPGR